MTLYHIWCDLKDGSKDLEFVRAVHAYLGHLKEQGHVQSYRITRRKFGFSPPGLGDFHIMVECENLGRLDDAFALVATRGGRIEELHRPVYSMATHLTTALYRDFPDGEREMKN
ncbi:MAG TPA: DUF6614 family protein [bacterium]|jgi:hypothetical protein